MNETKLENYKEAIFWLDSAIQIESKEPDYYVNRAMAKEGMKDSTAINDYKKALLLNPSIQRHCTTLVYSEGPAAIMGLRG
jgi:tetratricopeptide (TPR) repeat protein